MSDFLQLSDKTILVLGVANKKSVAWHAAKVLREAGADVIYSVRSEARRESVRKLCGDAPVLACDVEDQSQIERYLDRGITPRARFNIQNSFTDDKQDHITSQR